MLPLCGRSGFGDSEGMEVDVLPSSILMVVSLQ